MTNNLDDPWKRLLRAGANPPGAAGPPTPPPQPPARLVAALRARRAELWRSLKLMLWKRWAFILAMAAVLLFLGTLLVITRSSGPALLRPTIPNLIQP